MRPASENQATFRLADHLAKSRLTAVEFIAELITLDHRLNDERRRYATWQNFLMGSRTIVLIAQLTIARRCNRSQGVRRAHSRVTILKSVPSVSGYVVRRH